MKKKSKVFYVPTIPKHVRLSDFDMELTIDQFDMLIEISRHKKKITRNEIDELIKMKKTSALS